MGYDRTRRRLLASTGCLTAVTLAGCMGNGDEDGSNSDWAAAWPSVACDFRNTGHHPETTGPRDGVEEAWSTDVDDELENHSYPVIGDGLVYWAGTSDTVYAVDVETGEIEWEADAENGPQLVHDEKLYLSGHDHVTCLDAATGDELWARALTPKTSAVPDGDSIYVVGTGEPAENTSQPEYSVSEIDPATGESESLLRAQVEDPDRLEVDFATHPAVADGTLFFCEGDTVHAVDLEAGDHAWTYEHEDEIDVTGAHPVVGDGRVFVHARHPRTDDSRNSLRALDADSGEEQWRFAPEKPVRVFGSPAYVDGTLYQQAGGSVVAIDASTGEEQWAVQAHVMSQRPVAAGGYLYLLGHDTVSVVDPKTREVAQVAEGDEIGSRQDRIVYDDTIFFADDGGKWDPSTFYAFEAP